MHLYRGEVTRDQKIDREKIEKYLKTYSGVAKSFMASAFEKGPERLRKNLSNLGINFFQRVLFSAANDELKNKAGSAVANFVEFETTKKIKRTRIRKYDVNLFGASISKRSTVSGLPSRFCFILERSEDFGDQNMLPTLTVEALELLAKRCYSNKEEKRFTFSSIRLIDRNRLQVELSAEKNGLMTIDPFIANSKAPINKINDLLSKLGVE